MVRNLIDGESLNLICEHTDFSKFLGKKILITGGTGMVGSYLAEAIIRGSQLQGIRFGELKITGRTIPLEINERFSHCDNVNLAADSLNDLSITGQFQIIFHLASPASPTQYDDLDTLMRINSSCLGNLISEQTEKFIFMSTGEVYGNRNELLQEESHGFFEKHSSRDWYPYSKLMGEETSKELCGAVKSQVNIVRLFHTFGPGVRRNDGRSFADFLYSAADGNLPKLHSDGSALRTFLFSADAVNAILAISTSGVNLATYNVGSDIPISILDFAKRVSSIAGLQEKVLFDSTMSGGVVQSPNRALIPDLKKISSLGWRIQTSLDESIEKTLRFLREENFH